MQNRAVRIGPYTMTTAAANIANCAITSLAGPVGFTPTQPYLILTHIRIVNKSGSVANASLYIGASGGSAAGTEFAYNSTQIPANNAAGNYVDWGGRLRLESTDYLTGVASTGSALVFTAEGEIGFS